ncbi:hypothetical protein AMATHDRAFT_187685 [Amanita thiersii Skay4041]|uniref:Metallo-beta-lactamase domain-containing protein n=1 Tax=Amanita thiersii Skay4041 TaxID=703135 RepID=A0A2A9NW33_9AGAR|nr:hypothetical protein AMATHDRAFT_187685 [Amanita thiersii Skay4041]
MEKLEALSSIARLSENVIRVLAQNPGKFTLQGTNTYLIGKRKPYVLVDTGEGRDEYIPFLESALNETLQSTSITEPDISDIVISHWHHDHVGGLPAVLALLRKRWEARKSGFPYEPPRLHKLPLPPNKQPAVDPKFFVLPSIIKALPRDLFTPAANGSVFHDLHDGQQLHMSSTSPLRILHTPGHTVDSICIYVSSDRALYTSDTILGQGTAVFEDLFAYMASLNKMLTYIKSQTNGAIEPSICLYPGHGPVVADGALTIETYIKHRREREAEIVKLLQSPPGADLAKDNWTTWEIVKRIYAAYPESLWLPAARGIELHLRKLEADSVVIKLGGDGTDTIWSLNPRKD